MNVLGSASESTLSQLSPDSDKILVVGSSDHGSAKIYNVADASLIGIINLKPTAESSKAHTDTDPGKSDE